MVKDQQIDFIYKNHIQYYLPKYGGMISLNYILKVLRQAMLGDDPQQVLDIMNPPAHKLKETDETIVRNAKNYLHKFNSFRHKTNMRQLIEIIINLKIDEIMIADISRKQTMIENMTNQEQENCPSIEGNNIKKFEFGFQVYARACFIVWKLLAILHYSKIDLNKFSFQRIIEEPKIKKDNLNNDDSQSSSSEDPKFNRKQTVGSIKQIQSYLDNKPQKSAKIDKSVDLISVLQNLSEKYLNKKHVLIEDCQCPHDKKIRDKKPKKSSNSKKANIMKLQSQIFSKEEMQILQNYMAYFGHNDIRQVNLEGLKKLIVRFIEDDNDILFHPLKKIELYSQKKRGPQIVESPAILQITYIQFAQLCVKQQNREKKLQQQQLFDLYMKYHGREKPCHFVDFQRVL